LFLCTAASTSPSLGKFDNFLFISQSIPLTHDTDSLNSCVTEELQQIVKKMSDNVGKIYDSLPENSLIVVMSGTGNVAPVKR
jgi:4-diphosphocytidyl-2C-methyl-D-erythritol kinase